MTRWLAVAAAALALVGLALWWTGDQARTPRPPAAPVPVAPAAARSFLPVADAPPAALEEDAAFDEVGRAQAALQSHARRCWEARVPQPARAGEPDETTQSVRLRVRVVVRAGAGRAELLELADDRLSDAGLRACLVELAAVRWPSRGPDGVAELNELVRLGELTVPSGPPPASAPRPGVVPPERQVPPPPALPPE